MCCHRSLKRWAMSEEKVERVYCRECYWACAFNGNGCFCRVLLQRVCAGDKYGHPLKFCRGRFVAKATVKVRKLKDGQEFEFAGKRYRAITTGMDNSCRDCELWRYCNLPEFESEKEEKIGTYHCMIFKRV